MEYSFWFNMHSGIRWLIVFAFVVILLKFAVGYFQKSMFSALDGWLLSLYNMLLVIQFLLGLALIVWRVTLGVMPTSRWIHMLFMIAAVGVGASTAGRVRRAIGGDTAKFQTGLAGTLLSALLIIIGVTAINGW